MSVFPEVCPIKGNSELPPWGAVQAQNLLDSHRCFFPDFIRLLFTSNQSPGRPGLSEGLCLHGSMQRCGTCASASAGSVASARPARCRARSRHRQPRSRRRWRWCRRSPESALPGPTRARGATSRSASGAAGDPAQPDLEPDRPTRAVEQPLEDRARRPARAP